MKTFAELLVVLSRNQVKYILVGGLAVDLCGYSSVTHDVDIIIEYSKDNINLLISRLLNFGEGSAKELSYTDFDLEEGWIVEDFPLDIFTIMRSHTYQDLTRYVKKMLGDTYGNGFEAKVFLKKTLASKVAHRGDIKKRFSDRKY